jgi:hypothetical protein
MKKKQRRQRPQQPKLPKLRQHSANGRAKQEAQRAASRARAEARRREEEHIARTEEMMVMGVAPRGPMAFTINTDSNVQPSPRFGSRPSWMDSGRHG